MSEIVKAQSELQIDERLAIGTVLKVSFLSVFPGKVKTVKCLTLRLGVGRFDRRLGHTPRSR